MTVLALFPARVRFANDDGTLTNEASRFLQVMVARSGGALVGMDSPVAVTVAASPFLYSAGRDGHLAIVGGTVTRIEYGRQKSLTDAGTLNGLFPVTEGDSLTVTYADAPQITFIPR